MIVKNEMANLPRCLASVAPFIDVWIIGDTGSTDGSQNFIRAFFAKLGIPGEIHEFPFIDFTQARNEAYDCALRSELEFDYILFTDADMELVVPVPDFAERLDAQVYTVKQKSGASYWNVRLIRRDVPARYRGVTHEYIDSRGAATCELEDIFYLDHASGSNRVEKFERDARLLTTALESEKDAGLIARYNFYLANTWRDAGQYEKALPYYEKRVANGGWTQEIFMSLLGIAQIKSKLGHPVKEILAAFEAAHNSCPSRAEALHEAARFCRLHALFEQGYRYAAQGLKIPYPKNGLFVADWTYNYGLLDELSICAYWTGRYAESRAACDKLLNGHKLPASERERVRKNHDFAVENLEADWTHVAPDMLAYRQALSAAHAFQKISTSHDLIIEGFRIAAELRSDFAEALHAAARYCRNESLHKIGYEFAVRGLAVKKPADVWPQDIWIYDYGLLDEASITAYWTGRYAECVAMCEKLLSDGFVLATVRDRVSRNLAAAQDRLNEIEANTPHENDPFLRLLYEARRIETLELTQYEIMLAYRAAALSNPCRAEPWHDAARYCRNHGDHVAAVGWAQGGLNQADPGTVPGREDWIYRYGLRKEYAISANYSNDPAIKSKGRQICDGLALDRRIPESERKLARFNLRFYDKALSECAPSTHLQKIAFVPPDHYQAFNPSIARSANGFSLIQRTANYLIQDHKYIIHGDGRVITRNFLLDMDLDGRVLTQGEIFVSPQCLKKEYDLVLGLEDMRLCFWKGERWSISNIRQMNQVGWCEQFLGRIDPRPDGHFQISSLRRLVPPMDRAHEKNWIPVIDDQRLRFIHWHDPVRILDENANIIDELLPSIAADGFRGGSQAIAFDGGWLSVIHEVTESESVRVYLHRFVWFNADLNLKKVTEPFWFKARGIEFAAGLAHNSENDALIVSFGCKDRESYLATVSGDNVRKMLAAHS